MFTLQNFETQVDPVILQRGQGYFTSKAVCSLEETGKDSWLAIVEGTDTYQVAVSLKNQQEIKSFACSCPYDGAICKHVVAVFLALRKKLKARSGPHQRKNPGKEVFESLLQHISLQEYQVFIRDYALKDEIFKTDFELYFASKDDRIDTGKKYKERTRKLIRIFSDRGFIHYKDTFALASEVGALLQTSQHYFTENSFRQAFVIASVVVEEMMKVMPQCDDSAANISQTIEEAIQLIGGISAAAKDDPVLKEQMLDFLHKKLKDPLYFEYGDFGYNLFAVFMDLALDLHQTEVLLSFINTKLAKLGGGYEAYEKEYFLTRKIEILTALGNTKEAESLIWENLDVVAVRKGEVEKALTRQDYPAAKNLITEGIRVAAALDHTGTVENWQKQLLRLAVLEKDTETIRDYSLHFAFDRGFHLEYYQQWKSTYSKQEWPAVIDQFIADTVQRKIRKWEKLHGQAWQPAHPPTLQKLGPVYVQEKYWDRLLALVQQENNLDTTLSYHQYLVAHYPAELVSLYLPALEKYGQQATGRADYARLVAHMKMVMKAIPDGKEQIITLAHHLKEKYARRPAMVEELNKMLQ
jgi:hypothetical protein